MKRSDILLIGVLVLTGLGLFAAYHIFYRQAGAYVEITVDGKIYQNLSLEEEQQLEIPTGGGSSNILMIKDGCADMIEADCPDKLCVKQAKISHRGETIVCLPHKIVVTVRDEENGDNAVIDGHTY